jgi:hypothetical protein
MKRTRKTDYKLIRTSSTSEYHIQWLAIGSLRKVIFWVGVDSRDGSVLECGVTRRADQYVKDVTELCEWISDNVEEGVLKETLKSLALSIV